MKLFSVSNGINVNDYVIPLCFEKYNKEVIEECFWENYAIKHDKFLNGFGFNDIILNMIPDEIISHLYMDKLFVIYFHSKRKSNLFIPIHKDHAKIKFTGSINLPVYNCTEKVKTNFWLPIGEHTSIQMPKSITYESGELKEENIDLLHEISFPDHYDYTEKELKNLITKAKNNNAVLLTTEKDYLRISENFRKNIFYIKIKIEIENGNELIEDIKKII